MDGDRFVIQGDNNDWLDEDHPSADQVLGTLFLRVPHGGKVLAALRSPAALVVAGVAASPLARRLVRRPAEPARSPVAPPPPRASPAVLLRADPGLRAGRWPWSPAPSPWSPPIGGGVLLAMPSTQTESHAPCT